MNKIIKGIGITIIGVLIGFGAGLFINKCTNIKTTKMNPLPSYKEIEVLIDSKDSLENRIDTIWIELNDVNQDYETSINHIINNAPDSNYVFFIEYVGSQKQRLDSIISDRC